MNKKLIKNTSMLYLLNFAKIFFPLLTLPYLTRVLAVDVYGKVSYVKAVMQYMQLVVDFGFLLSGTKDIVFAKANKEKLRIETNNLFFARLLLSVIALMFLIILIFINPILNEIYLFVLLSFVPVFLTIFLFDYLFRGLEKMEIITIRFVIMRGISTILTFVFIKSDADIILIPIIDIIGSIFAVILVLWEVRKLDIRLFIPKLGIVAHKIRMSSIYFFSNLATTAFMALNTLLIGLLLSNEEIAYWSLSIQMVTAVQSLYTPITDGIYPQMVEKRDVDIIRKIIIIITPIIVIGCIFTFSFSKLILLAVGGSKYVSASYVLRSLIPVLFFSFYSMLFGWPVLGAFGKQKETTFTTIITAIVQIVGLFGLVVIGKFTLVNIALLRGLTELLLCFLRVRYYIIFKHEF